MTATTTAAGGGRVVGGVECEKTNGGVTRPSEEKGKLLRTTKVNDRRSVRKKSATAISSSASYCHTSANWRRGSEKGRRSPLLLRSSVLL